MGSHTALILATVVACILVSWGEKSSSTDSGNDSSSVGLQASFRIVQSLFRFPASRFGPEFEELLQTWHKEWLHSNMTSTSATITPSSHLPPVTPEPVGKSHAFHSVSTAAATLFRRQCYGPAPRTPQLRNLYNNFEQRRKRISFEYMKDAREEMRLLHTMTKRFYPAFLLEYESKKAGNGNIYDSKRIHEKKLQSDTGTIHAQSTLPYDYDAPSKLSFQTISGSKDDNSNRTQDWSWYPPGHFSSRGTPDNMIFRLKMYKSMRGQLQRRLQQLLPDFAGLEYGRQSGMFWYPPGGVREWHNNYLDLVGNVKSGRGQKEEEIFASQVWRMYFIRTLRDPEFDEELAKLKKSDIDWSNNDHSAMHIIPGDDSGISLDVLRNAGLRPLKKEEMMRQWSDEFAEDYPIPPEYKEKNTDGDEIGSLDRNSVWRIPDQDGYVTLFRLPDIWHCIISEEVHRYSLGFAFSDREVQALLRLAGIEFDVANSEEDKNGRLKEEL